MDFLKRILLVIAILSCLSCKEKLKPFTYDYVEIARGNSCWGGYRSCKIDSNKVIYIPDNSIFDNWEQPVTIGKLSDNIQLIVDSIAYKVYKYKDNIIKTGCMGCDEYAVIVVRDSVKKIYYSNNNKFIDGDIYMLLEGLNKLKRNKNFRLKDTTLRIAAVKFVEPPTPPPPPPVKPKITFKE